MIGIWSFMKSDNLKTLITAPSKKQGGVASFVDNILPYFSSPIHVFLRGKKNEKSIPLHTAYRAVLSPFSFFVNLVRVKPEKVIINTSLSKTCLIRDGLFIIISKILGKKVFLIIHGFQENALKYSLLLKYGYFQSDSIAVLSSSFSKMLKDAGYKKPIYTQWNPVSDKIIIACENKIIDLANKKKLTILFLSRIERYKGIFTALDAFKRVQKKYSNISFKIGGTGKALQDAKQYVMDNKITNVEFLGYVRGKEKVEVLKKSDIFLFPTEHKEGLPINVLEAMTAGHIIITRPVAGLVDLYEKCNFGFSIESTDPVEYVDAISEILANKQRYSKIAQNNAEFAKENFHPKVVTQKLENILEKL
jgi:glycosyltransferase involved in cell wall biosynthesis